MRHARHYTLEEARELRPWVAAWVEMARAAGAVLRTPEARAALAALDLGGGGAVAGRAAGRAALAALDLGGGGAWPGRAVARATLELQRAVAELHAADIVVRDVVRGLVD